MAGDAESKRLDFLRTLTGVRDSFMEDFAKVALKVTQTRGYQQANAAFAKPMLLATAVFREKREAAMSELLALLNIPSRDDVLALSQRLTRIEMTLDDLGAGMDQIRRAPGQAEHPEGRQATNGRPRAPRSTTKEG